VPEHVAPCVNLIACAARLTLCHHVKKTVGSSGTRPSLLCRNARFSLASTCPLQPPATLHLSAQRRSSLTVLLPTNLTSPISACSITLNGTGDAAAWQPRAEVLKIEELLAARLGIPVRGGDMVQPWAAPPDAGPRVPLALRFTFSIDVLPDAALSLMLEQPDQQRITVNGIRLPVPQHTGWFIDPCFRTVPLPASLLHLGVNNIVLERHYGSGSDLEAIYLLGTFGVTLSSAGATLARLPATLQTGSVTDQGLPFYSGHIRYHINAGRHGRLALPGVAAACVTFRSPDGRAVHAAPWAPFECQLDQLASRDGVVIADLALTRRNTFGPLHLVPIDQPAIGPHSFRSSGDAWSDAYQLIPAGLTASPQVTGVRLGKNTLQHCE